MKKGIFLFLIFLPMMLSSEDWPQFRGPSGQGISQEKNLPVSWSETEGVLWKTAIPGEGWSSPIVFDNKIYITSACDSGVSCRILAIDLASGSITWNREVFQQQAGQKEMRNSYATPTPVTDGKAIYAAFNDGSMVAVDTHGQLLWQNRQFKFYSQHGLGVSPILFQNLVIIPHDGSSPAPNTQIGWQEPWDKAYILALDKSNGKVVWQAKRGLSRIAHVTPAVIHYQGKSQLASGAGDVIQGFDLATGDRIWTAASKGEGVVPSIVFGDNLIFSASGFGDPTIRAIRMGGTGTITDTHLAWEVKENVPMIPSFIYQKPYLFTITENGMVMCLQAASGQIVWTHRLSGKFSASPVYADGKIYFLSEKGKTPIIEAAPAFKQISESRIDGTCRASIAVSNGKILIRSDSHLYCIGR
jgi:outer membrane protein assembly factor BamB